MTADLPRVALVTGANGTLGRRVASNLARRGIAVTGIARGAPPVNWAHAWITGDMTESGMLRSAAAQADTIVHCATDPGSPERDFGMVRELVEVGRTLGRHVVHVSIAGIENATGSPYYVAKLEGERLLRASGVPHALIRSTQFHSFVLSILQRLEFVPFLLCPCVRFQPVEANHIADVIGRCVATRAVASVTINGPERLSVRDLASAWMRQRHVYRVQLPMPALGPLAPMALLSPVRGLSGGLTWSEWLKRGDGA